MRKHRAWFDGQLDLDPEKLVFIDETGLSTKMARLRGRAKRGERCRSDVRVSDLLCIGELVHASREE